MTSPVNSDGAIEMLIAEHRIIQHVVEGFGSLALHLREGLDVDLVELRESVAFMREYVDRCHLTKEKDLLYPACVDYGILLVGHPMAYLLQEISESRKLADQLAEWVGQFSSNKARINDRLDAIEKISTEFDSISKLYLRHINDEEEIVFPVAQLVLPPATRNRLYAQFKEIDARNPPGTHERFHAFAKRLSAITAR